MKLLLYQSIFSLVVVLASCQHLLSIECTDGEVRDSLEYRKYTDSYVGEVEYCGNGNWTKVCSSSENWIDNSATVVCRQLGYSDQRSKGGALEDCTSTSSYVSIDCNGTEERVDHCNISDCSCSNGTLMARASCIGVYCADGEIRLVGGSTYREGRVEVCMDGRWGTVCNNSQEGIESSICYQAGFFRLSAATTSSNATIKPVRYQCVFDEDGNTCTGSSSTYCDLAVTCMTHEETAEHLLKTLNESNESCAEIKALLSVTVVILIAVTSGWIATCVVAKWYLVHRGKKSQEDNCDILNTDEQYPHQRREGGDSEHTYDEVDLQMKKRMCRDKGRRSCDEEEVVTTEPNRAYVSTMEDYN